MKTKIDDECFIGRVYKTSAFLWAFVCLVCLSLWGWEPAVGWTLGSAISVGVLRSLEWVIRRSFVPGAGDAKRSLAKVSLLKLPIVIMILAGVVLLGGKSFALILGLCAGATLTQSVIVLKVLGTLICEYSNNLRIGGLR